MSNILPINPNERYARSIDNTYTIARETPHLYIILCDLYYIITMDALFRSKCNNIIIVNKRIIFQKVFKI